MNVLVTGSDGQLGQEIKKLVVNKKKYFFTNRKSVDITKKNEILDFINKNQIYLVINCAAYTDVNASEKNKEIAMKINSHGVKNLAEVCEKKKLKIIHFSTDYVYNGINLNPIKENEHINPQNFYGLSKREGELYLQKSKCQSIIIRTYWLYSHFGNNFVNKIISIAKERKKIHVVDDQYGCPTCAKDLAKIILYILNSNTDFFKKKIICNYSNEGYTSWYGFAKKIIELTNINCEVLGVKSLYYKKNAIRSSFLVTDKSKLKNLLKIQIPHWEDSLKTHLT